MTRGKIAACWSAVLMAAVLVIVALSAHAQAANPTCSNQSPRNIDRATRPSPYDGTSKTSIVKVLTADTIEYTPRAGGTPVRLTRCGQHYHLPIEDPQGCPGEITPGTEPKPGDWVEVHTVFAAKLNPEPCNPENLSCCLAGPFVVRAFNAKVTAEGGDQPILPPPGRPLAEWSGSTTGPDNPPGECKPPAQWSFRLGCGFTLSEAQLRHFKHADPARPVQTGNRLSKDLTLVTP